MKNIWIMLLLVCSACVFNACDDDEKTKEPVAPTATFPQTLTIGQEITVDGKDFATNAKLVLKNSTDETKSLDIEGAIFTETSVKFAVPANVETGNYKIVVSQHGKEYDLGTVEIISEKVTKRIAKIIYSDPYGASLEYAMTYKDGQIGQIEYVYKEDEEELVVTVYDVTREENQITMESEDGIVTYALKEGKVAGYKDVYDADYRLEYDNENYLTSFVAIFDEEEEVIEYNYSDNKNLEDIGGSGLKFGEEKNILNGVDPVICIYKFFIGSLLDVDFFPHLLGLCGNSSANLPVSSDVLNGNCPIGYNYETWGGIQSITYTNDGEVSTITFEYED